MISYYMTASPKGEDGRRRRADPDASGGDPAGAASWRRACPSPPLSLLALSVSLASISLSLAVSLPPAALDTFLFFFTAAIFWCLLLREKCWALRQEAGPSGHPRSSALGDLSREHLCAGNLAACFCVLPPSLQHTISIFVGPAPRTLAQWGAAAYKARVPGPPSPWTTPVLWNLVVRLVALWNLVVRNLFSMPTLPREAVCRRPHVHQGPARRLRRVARIEPRHETPVSQIEI